MINYGILAHGEAVRNRTINRYYNEFLDKGREFTDGYLEGRKWNPLNSFSLRHKAAKKALEVLAITEMIGRVEKVGTIFF
jgi:hypothetical protein